MKTVIEMAREAGIVSAAYDAGFMDLFTLKLNRFADLVRADERDRAMRENAYVAAEREACAKVIESYDDHNWGMLMQDDCAAAIRARGNP